MSQPTVPLEEEESVDSPRHGFRGQHQAGEVRPTWPSSLTIAITREAGARGATIAKRAGAKLGWQVFSQDLMEFMAQEGQASMGDPLPGAAQWIDEHLNHLLHEQYLSRHPAVVNLAKVILALGVAGETVLLGRGAGCILPAPSTLHVRLVAPLNDRIAYMSQWLRLTHEEAAEQVRKRDSRRAEFIATHFHRRPGDVHQYDLVLNSSLLGEEGCADLIVQGAKGKLATMCGEQD